MLSVVVCGVFVSAVLYACDVCMLCDAYLWLRIPAAQGCVCLCVDMCCFYLDMYCECRGGFFVVVCGCMYAVFVPLI